MNKRWLATAALAAAALLAAGCGSSGSGGGSSTTPAASSALKTAKIGGATVLTDAQGFALYWFGPDTSAKSSCNGRCAQTWPPVKGPATLGPGIAGALSTITRSDGSTQATYDGHPLYAYSLDTKPGEATGNGVNASGGIWHEMTVSGAAPAPSSTSSRSGGYGY